MVQAPWQYDVIEDYYDREKPLVVVVSDFLERNSVGMASTSDQAGRHPGANAPAVTDLKDDIIADAPSDAGMGERRQFIWWSNSYHFTTDEKGEVLADSSPNGLLNPIGMLPFVNNAEEQDGQFWAVGGDDLIDGSILVNKLVTDMNFISYLQGYGQWVLKGQNVSKEKFKMGPNNAIILEYDPSKDEPEPSVEVITASPPLAEWRQIVEQYVALLLTTNNLSPSNVSGALSANDFPSGIAILIEQSESTDDITDTQKQYVAIERTLWEILRRWLDVYDNAGALCEDFAAIGKLPEELDLSIKFMEAKPAITEAEKLANIKVRKDLGINEQVDLIMLDNPDMTREEAEAKLKAILEEKMKNASLVAPKPMAAPGNGQQPPPANADVPQEPPPNAA
jgi:hypothetical protein